MKTKQYKTQMTLHIPYIENPCPPESIDFAFESLLYESYPLIPVSYEDIIHGGVKWRLMRDDEKDGISTVAFPEIHRYHGRLGIYDNCELRAWGLRYVKDITYDRKKEVYTIKLGPDIVPNED